MNPFLVIESDVELFYVFPVDSFDEVAYTML
jgi:hypothetical protein